MATTDDTHRCPTCGAAVTLVEGDERTSWYLPIKPSADADATNMAVAIKFALRSLPAPEVEAETNPIRAAGIGALQGAISAHERRLAGDDPMELAGWNRPTTVSKAHFVAGLRDMLALVEADDSAGGFIEYEWGTEPDSFDVRMRYRVGNSMGQGGIRILHDEDGNAA